jgi:GNAT superfamily N-acetyltransferase
MCDEWMPALQLQLSPQDFVRLPRNAAYQYEYARGKVLLNPRPRHYHAMLDLQGYCPSTDSAGLPGIAVRPMTAADIPELEPVFAAAFHRIQPFGSLDDGAQREAARQCLQRTRTGGDGPWIEQASFVASRLEDQGLCGGILITLLPAGDPNDWDSYYWAAVPPPDCVAQRLGRPHLTWVFVSPTSAGHNIGTALLSVAVRRLVELGYTELVTTFMLGNESSMLWHWRNGFRLLPYPGSPRRARRPLRDTPVLPPG